MRRSLAGFFHSFRCAGGGFVRAVRQERNLRFHLCAGVYVGLFSMFYHLSAAQYAILAVVVFGVIALELANSAIERAVDCASPGPSELARAAKDVAAAAVLAFCVGAVVVGVLFFWDTNVLAGIAAWFAAKPAMLALLVLSLVASFWFVFGFGNRGGKG